MKKFFQAWIFFTDKKKNIITSQKSQKIEKKNFLSKKIIFHSKTFFTDKKKYYHHLKTFPETLRLLLINWKWPAYQSLRDQWRVSVRRSASNWNPGHATDGYHFPYHSGVHSDNNAQKGSGHLKTVWIVFGCYLPIVITLCLVWTSFLGNFLINFFS